MTALHKLFGRIRLCISKKKKLKTIVIDDPDYLIIKRSALSKNDIIHINNLIRPVGYHVVKSESPNDQSQVVKRWEAQLTAAHVKLT